MADVTLARRASTAAGSNAAERGEPSAAVGLEFRYALVMCSINEVAARVSTSLLDLLIRTRRSSFAATLRRACLQRSADQMAPRSTD
ncbi:hypothetical protein [Amycolatopsis sp. NPDC051071]|uniref:hypothetical protein n=1 Tax=Amycolatopsis sp. NPDC051071 TaxID=3154637 RepID=UPI0034133F53